MLKLILPYLRRRSIKRIGLHIERQIFIYFKIIKMGKHTSIDNLNRIDSPHHDVKQIPVPLKILSSCFSIESGNLPAAGAKNLPHRHRHIPFPKKDFADTGNPDFGFFF